MDGYISGFRECVLVDVIVGLSVCVSVCVCVYDSVCMCVYQAYVFSPTHLDELVETVVEASRVC